MKFIKRLIFLLLLAALIFVLKTYLFKEETPLLPLEIASADQKLEAYKMSCSDDVQRDLQIRYQDYQDWFEQINKEAAEIQMEESLFDLSFTDDCIAQLHAANAMEPFLPEIENYVNNYAGSVKTLSSLLTEAGNYYDHREYRADKFERGLQIDQQIMDEFESAFYFYADFQHEILLQQTQLRERYLSYLEANEGPEDLLDSLKVMVLSERISFSLSPELLETLDEHELQNRLTNYEQALVNLNTSSLPPSGETFIQSANELLELAQTSLADGQSPSQEALEDLKEHYQSLGESYDLLFEALMAAEDSTIPSSE